jgi:hypothetical protein
MVSFAHFRLVVSFSDLGRACNWIVMDAMIYRCKHPPSPSKGEYLLNKEKGRVFWRCLEGNGSETGLAQTLAGLKTLRGLLSGR